MRRVSPYARQLRRGMTVAERAIWFAVRDRRFSHHKFRRQTTIGPYIVDFVCMDAN